METAAAVGARVGITTTQYLILWITFVGLFILLIYIISKQLKLIRTLGVFSQYHNSSVAPNNLTFPLCCFDQISCWLPKDTS